LVISFPKQCPTNKACFQVPTRIATGRQHWPKQNDDIVTSYRNLSPVSLKSRTRSAMGL
jgi:hypothetical protein